jgi:ATP-dependent DNA helicase PIF1
MILDRLSGAQRSYLATDSLKEVEDVGVTDIDPSILLSQSQNRFLHGLPPYSLALKIGCVCRILRNMSISRSLVRNTRVVVTHLGERIISVRILRSHPNGEFYLSEDEYLLPRISFSYSLSSGHTLLRRQYPLDLAYSTTFNSCQGLTLDRVAVDLTTPVFSHGQLYTAFSRIRRRTDGIVRLLPQITSVPNVTYPQILL